MPLDVAIMYRTISSLCNSGLRSCAVLVTLFPLLLSAQQINLSLHTTVVPDSFVVRATATEGAWGAVPNAVFTIRWELASGGVANNGDVRRGCEGYTLANYGGTVDIGNHRYFTLVLTGERPLEQASCPITPAGIVVGGVRIRELSGCRHVELVQNAYTGMNNLDYHFSMGGIGMTGVITSDPIPGGDCEPCVPPMITSASAVQGADCNSPTVLSMEAEGTALDISWYGLYSGLPRSYLANDTINGHAGPFLLVVNGPCGSDTMVVPVSLEDTTACMPPEIISATSSFGPAKIKFRMTATGTCLQYVVVAPDGVPYSYVSNGQVPVPNSAGSGEYLAITYNACGSDTVVFWFDEILQCTPPQIVSANGSVPPCQTTPLTLSCTAVGPGPISYQWMDPFGVVVGSSANATVPAAIAGDYSITVSNACSSNWTLVPLVLDTAGVGACVPPQILSLTTNAPICAGDTLLLHAEVIADGPCLNYQWSGSNVVQNSEASTMAPGASGGNYTLMVSNACGTVAMSVQPAVFGQQNRFVILCSPEGLHSLDSLADMTLPSGSWYMDGESHPGYYDPAVDTSGYYFYHQDTWGCPVVRINLREYDAVYAGADTAITVCSTDPLIPLFPLLGVGAMPGGSWSIGIGAFNGTYDPAFHNSNTCRYVVMNGGCNDMAYVYVTKIPATPWYADTDGDGYGDESDEVLACEQPDGHVANADDTCPETPGLIGDACDDGAPATVNDVINEECICAGELSTGLSENDLGTSQLWPNPNQGDVFYLQLGPSSGTAIVMVTDATGRIVLRTVVPESATPIAIALPSDVASGSYMVGIVTSQRAEVKRLVVAH